MCAGAGSYYILTTSENSYIFDFNNQVVKEILFKSYGIN